MKRCELAPGGSFEDSSWSLGGGAQIVPGGEPFGATGSQSTSSLSMPAGSSAQSPSTCVDAAYPSIVHGRDGSLHLTYTYTLSGKLAKTDAQGQPARECIKYVHLNEEWITTFSP